MILWRFHEETAVLFITDRIHLVYNRHKMMMASSIVAEQKYFEEKELVEKVMATKPV